MGDRIRIYIDVEPKVLKWALQRSGKDATKLSSKSGFKRLSEWLNGSKSPTLPQLEMLAKATYTPFGYLLLPEPPDDPPSPIPHFRTMDNDEPSERSINLEDTIRFTKRRQEWVREYLIEIGTEPLPFVNSCAVTDDPVEVATKIRDVLDLEEGWAKSISKERNSWSIIRDKIESKQIFLARTSMVKHHASRKLNPEEFRGFVLVDDYAPFIFVNSADYPPAQMFTLAHELAHIWLGKSASFDLHKFRPANNIVERACNKIAAELLVPTQIITDQWDTFDTSDDVYRDAAKRFGVSKIVVARRALDTNCISQDQFNTFYQKYQQNYEDWKTAKKQKKLKSGAPPHKTMPAYISPRFMDILIASVGEGRTRHREAYALTNTGPKTFDSIKKRAEEEMRP